MLSLLSRKSGAKIAFLFGFSLQVRGFFDGFPSWRGFPCYLCPFGPMDVDPTPNPFPRGRGFMTALLFGISLRVRGFMTAKIEKSFGVSR